MRKAILSFLAAGLLLGAASGQELEARINQRLSSESARAGSAFDATLARPFTLDGRTCAKGSRVQGIVSEAKSSGRLSSPGVLAVEPTSVTCGGRKFFISAEPVRLEGRSHTKRNAVLIGGGAAAGSLLGGLLGGGKGALIGAAVGAGGGTAGAAAGGKHEAVIEPEAVVAWQIHSSATSQVRSRNEQPRNYYGNHDGDDDHDRHDRDDDRRGGREYVFSESERSYLRSCLSSNYRLPPGLAKQGKIPPGHAKKMQRAAYGDPIPGVCVARLSPIPAGWSRVIVDERVLLMNAAHQVIDYFIWRQ